MSPADLGTIATAFAVVLTAIIGFLAYRANVRGAKNTGEIGVIDAALKVLNELGSQQTKELERLRNEYSDCELERVLLKERIAKLDGQIDVLKSMATGAAAETFKSAADAAKVAVDVAAKDAATAVNTAAKAAEERLPG